MFLKGKKLNISPVFVSQSCLNVPKTIRLNAAHYFIMKIPNRRKLQHIAPNHLFDIEFKDLMKLYKDYTKEPFSFLVNNTNSSSDIEFKDLTKLYKDYSKEPFLFLVNDTTLSSDNPLRFRKNLR